MIFMMSPHVAWNSWNMTFLDTKLKTITMFSWRRIKSRWRSNVHLMSRINVSHPPLVTIPNWCRTNVFQRHHEIEGLKNNSSVCWHNISPMAMKQTPLEGLVIAKRRITPRTWAIWHEMWPCQYENKVVFICKIF
jgi:hypothetical protein